MIKRACILTGGRICVDFLKKHMEKEKYHCFIVVDGALIYAKEAGIVPDYIVGDFDTVEELLLEEYPKEIVFRHPPEKDWTDTELAAELAVRDGCREIVFLGATGTRLDHSLANIFLLQQLLENGIQGMIVDEYNKLYIRNRSFFVEKEKQYGKFFSLLPLTDKVTGVTLTGVKYPVEKRDFYRKHSLGVSNEIIEDVAVITFCKGCFLVLETSDRGVNL